MAEFININYFWTAFAMILIVVMGTVLSGKNKFWELFFTFIFPFAITTPMVFMFNRLDSLSDSVFTLIKLYSVLCSAILVWFIRHKPNTIWGRRLRIIFFAINVLEALAIELIHGFYINPIAGIIILATMPRWQTLEVTINQQGEKQLRWDSTLYWVFAYSLWHNSLAISLYPALWFLNTLHVLIGLILVFRDPRLYAQIRAVSLNITFSVMIAFLPALDVIISKSNKFGPFGNMENFNNFTIVYNYIALLAAIGVIIQQIHLKRGRVAQWLKLEKTKIKVKVN